MKKVLSVLLAIIIVFSFCSCGSGSSNSSSYGNSLSSKKNTEPLNAQNFVSRLKDSDGFVYCLSGGPCVLYFTEDAKKFKFARINDNETLSVDYSVLSNEVNNYYFDVYNDSHYSTSRDWVGSNNYTFAYADPENRFVIFTDDDRYEEGDVNIELCNILNHKADAFMSKEDMKSFLKSYLALAENYSYEELMVLYPSTLEGQIKLITDCIEAAN